MSKIYDPLTHAYMLLCGAVHLIEEYDAEVFLQLSRLPNRSAYHVTNSLMNTILDAHHLLRDAVSANMSGAGENLDERMDSHE